jgi:uncharacterized membrane protein
MKTLIAILALTLLAGAQTFTTFVVNPRGSDALAINDSGTVVGIYGCIPSSYCAYTRDSLGVIKRWGLLVSPLAINNAGEFVGMYNGNPAFHSLPNGKLLKYLRGFGPSAVAVNTAGWITGSYCININKANESCAAYLMDPTDVISTIFAPSGSFAWATGLNNSNQVVGYWSAGVTTQGFVYSNGVVNSEFNFPGAVATNPYAINDSGEIVGSWTDSVGFVHGFYWTAKVGFTSFDVPKTTHTIPTAVNASGVIVGDFATRKQTASSGFMLDAAGVLTIINVPNARSTQAYGINSQGTIVGTYEVGPKFQTRAFLYQP